MEEKIKDLGEAVLKFLQDGHAPNTVGTILITAETDGENGWFYRTTTQGAYVAPIAKIVNLLLDDLATGDAHYAKEYVYDLKKKMEESDTGEDSNIIGYPDGHDEDFRPIEEDALPDLTECRRPASAGMTSGMSSKPT
jgi:hypothetical protein